MAHIKDRRQFASIYCQKPLPAGEELGLEIQPPNRQSILVFAKPIWAIDTDSSESTHCCVFGVRFEYISEDDIQFLGDIVDKQSQ
jgi:hypothetical protein